MGWDEYEEPDGFCVDCGAETAEAHHRWCMPCYREQMRDDDEEPAPMPSPAFPGDERWKIAYLRGYREGYAAGLAANAA